jgi:hypothetical protein
VESTNAAGLRSSVWFVGYPEVVCEIWSAANSVPEEPITVHHSVSQVEICGAASAPLGMFGTPKTFIVRERRLR